MCSSHFPRVISSSDGQALHEREGETLISWLKARIGAWRLRQLWCWDCGCQSSHRCGDYGIVGLSGLQEGRFTLVFLAAPGDDSAQVELTYNWDGDELGQGSRNFGHLAYAVDDIYEVCQRLADGGVTINRPPRDGKMAFVRSPDNISVELLQVGDPLPTAEPWVSMENVGEW